MEDGSKPREYLGRHFTVAVGRGKITWTYLSKRGCVIPLDRGIVELKERNRDTAVDGCPNPPDEEDKYNDAICSRGVADATECAIGAISMGAQVREVVAELAECRRVLRETVPAEPYDEIRARDSWRSWDVQEYWNGVIAAARLLNASAPEDAGPSDDEDELPAAQGWRADGVWPEDGPEDDGEPLRIEWSRDGEEVLFTTEREGADAEADGALAAVQMFLYGAGEGDLLRIAKHLSHVGEFNYWGFCSAYSRGVRLVAEALGEAGRRGAAAEA